MPSDSQSSKVLTLLFTDLAGSTSLKAERGDDAAGVLIAKHREHVKQLAQVNEGRIIDWAGDGCFLTFETPSAAVRFALKLQQVHEMESEFPKLYVGIHMGEIVERPGPAGEDGPPRVEGLAVDIASRIQSLAFPGQILMSGSVFNSARQHINSQEMDTPISWQAHGAYLFTDFDDSIPIGEVGIEGISPLQSPEGTKKVQRTVTIPEEDMLGWRPATGLSIPGRKNWVLHSHLGTGGFGEVWLATNVNTQSRHVFKFCFEPERIKGIKREVVLLRLLKESLGDREDIAQVVDWEINNPPYYIESEYTEGGDLKSWAQNQGGINKILLETRLELVAQTAVALSAAHSAGVLHKDIKPSNILISQPQGKELQRASLTDFGIGLLTDPEVLKEKGITATGLTQTLVEGKSSSTSGTALYMAPELLEGKLPTPQSDIFSLGVLMYQMIIGDFSRALAQGWEQDLNDELLREDVTACINGVPEDRLADPMILSERIRSLKERRRVRDGEYQAKKVEEKSLIHRQRIKKMSFYGTATVVVLAIIAAFIILQHRASSRESKKTWAYEKAIPEIRKLLESEKYVTAYNLALKAKKFIPNDPTLVQFIEQSSSIIDVRTTPPGAFVFFKPYTNVDGEYIKMGTTPIDGVRLPVGMYRWKIQKEDYQEREVVRKVHSRDWYTEQDLKAFKPIFGDFFKIQFDLFEESRVPKATIGIARGPFMLTLKGVPPVFTGKMELDHFFIDRTEVTNRAYKEFIDAGGYSNPGVWKQEFKKNGQVISWTEAMKAFTDQTGRPGPSTWELGNYPEGHGDYPVSGVSWFEAAAYAEFRGKNLPTIYHWVQAALPFNELFHPLSSFILPQSNFGGQGPAKVGTHPGLGISGAKDMAGNVREWCWNAVGEKHYSLGGMWKDPMYMFTDATARSSWDRSPGNGFRCAVYPEGTSIPDKYFSEVNLAFHDPYSIPPRSVEDIREFKSQWLSYRPTPLRPVLEAEHDGGRDWTREKVTIDAAYNEERFSIHIYLPTSGTPPYKAVIYFPGGSALRRSEFELNPWIVPWDSVPKSGRAFIAPIYSETFERRSRASRKQPKKWMQMWIEWLKDIGRTIDYLEGRPDIDTKNIAYWGLSLGAAIGPAISVYEDRIRVLVLFGGGRYWPAHRPKPKSVVLPLVKIPVLMLNGRSDYLMPVETHQKTLFNLIGTPPEHKRHILYDAGHIPFPRTQSIRDILEWLDRYQ